MRSVRKVAILLLAILLLPGMLSACGGRSNTSEKGDGLSIVTTVFPLYDWTRAVLGEEAQAQVTFLLDTGVDLHSFQPTAADLLKISGCDLFLYVGGASDGWVVDALRAAPREGRMELGMLSVLGDRVRMEELVEGMAGEAEEEPEADEHVWLSLKNAARLVDGITEALCALDGEEAETYRANAAAYIQKLTALDQAYENAVSAAGIRTLLFGDRLYEGLRGNEVRELQYFLAFIAQFEETVRPVDTDGIFGPVTRGAVEDFQRDAGLAVTGEVDRTTWELLYRRYMIYRDSLPDDYFPVQTKPYPGTPLRTGSRGEDVRLVQSWLNRIGEGNGSLPRLAEDGIYGQRTADAVRAWQRIAGLDPTGAVASYTWESLANAYRALEEGRYGSEGQFGGVLGPESV